MLHYLCTKMFTGESQKGDFFFLSWTTFDFWRKTGHFNTIPGHVHVHEKLLVFPKFPGRVGTQTAAP